MAHSNQTWATAAVQDILNRPADSGSVNYLLNQLASGASRVQAALSLVRSPEYDSNLIASYFNKYLGRTAQSSEIAPYVNELQMGLSDEMVIESFLTSAEYFLKTHQFP